MKKRMLALTLALSLLMAMNLAVPAFAAGDTYTEVVPCIYDEVKPFSEGLAAVKLDGKWGFIDKAGQVVIPLQYSGAGRFSEGMAGVELNGLYGFIDKTGNQVVPCIYKRVESFSEGLAVVQDENYKRGYVDKTGKEVIPCQYTEAADFSEGLASVYVGEYPDPGVGHVGFIDKTGREVLSPQYGDGNSNTVYSFSEGLAAVQEPGKYYSYGFIDKTGQVVLPYQYLQAGDFSEGFALVQMGRVAGSGKWGYIDKAGNIVVPCQYDSASDVSKVGNVSEGMAAVHIGEYRGGKWGFIALNGASSSEQPTNGPQVSDWAKESVSRAAENGLVPDSLGNDYRVSITRAQFAAVAVKLYEAMSGQKAPAAGESPFIDTSDTAVIQAQALGIVNGVGDGKFAPNALMTREQAATMLSRVYTKLGGNIPEVAATTFADNGNVSGWARDAVAFMAGKGIVNGVGNNQFSPQGNASIEQALVIALRMFDNLK